jgi:hypothetical protein
LHCEQNKMLLKITLLITCIMCATSQTARTVTTVSDITIRSVSYGGQPYRSTRFVINRGDEPAGHSSNFITHANHDNFRFHCRRYQDRGWNILVISRDGTQIGDVQSFDSYGGRINGQRSSGSANDKMATYINGIADGNFVLVATTDYATTSSQSRAALFSIGGTSSVVGQVSGRDAYTLIGYKGSNKPAGIPKEQGPTSTIVTITWVNTAPCEQGLGLVLLSDLSTSVCSTCMQGYYSPGGYNALCKACENGTYSNNTAATECTVCEKGYATSLLLRNTTPPSLFILY